MNGAGSGGTFVGTLRSWREPWGFITCPDFEGDLFAHREQILGSVPLGDLTGASVQFERGADEKGRKRAARIVLLSYGKNSPQLLQQQMQQQSQPPPPPPRPPPTVPPPPVHSIAPLGYVAPPGYGAPSGHGAPSQPSQSSSRRTPSSSSGSGAAHLAGQRMRGEIRIWKEKFGFIVCPAKFQGDIFVHPQNMDITGGPADGKQVSFTISIDQKGRCCATEVTDASPAPEDFVGLGPITGEVRSWKREWGFITSPSFMGDLFCHQGSVQWTSPPPEGAPLAQLLTSAAVTFEVTIDQKGRTSATQASLCWFRVLRKHVPL